MSMQGYLKKRNERGVWQQRWFVLQGLELKYYNSQKDATGGKDPNMDVSATVTLPFSHPIAAAS